MSEPLRILNVSVFPASPPTFGAQRRIHGLLAGLARRHEVTAVSLYGPDFDRDVAERAMREYCREVYLIPGRQGGLEKRLLQLRSLASLHSFERLCFSVPELQATIDRLLATRTFDIVNIETPAISHLRLRRNRSDALPKLTLDDHNIEYDLIRQQAAGSLARRFYNGVNWRKLRREEHFTWRTFDGVAFTSALDEQRARADVPTVRSVVVPNAVDVEYFKPRPEDPKPDGRTVMFFGLVDYFPNRDGLGWLLKEVWPLVEKSHPHARLKIVGPRPTPEILAARGPRVEVTGMVDDLRPHLAEAAVSIVPLRIGGGTRLKIVEAMGMAKAIVSTTLGAEGIELENGREILIADEPASFAAAIGRVLDDPALAESMGRAARKAAEDRYSWNAAADRLEAFYLELLGRGHEAAGGAERAESERKAG